MKKFMLLASISTFAECFSLIGFVMTNHTAFIQEGKIFFQAFFFIIVIATLWSATKAMTKKNLALFSITITLTFLIFYNVVGYIYYPGLVKDVDFLSIDHIKGSIAAFVLLSGTYILIAMLFSFVRKKKRRDKSTLEQL